MIILNKKMKKSILFLMIFFNSIVLANKINQEKILKLDEENKALFKEVRNFTEELLANEESLLKDKLKKFEDDPDTMDSKSLNSTMNRALKIAQGYGMDTAKLTSLYKLSKKVILRSEFKEYNSDTKTFTQKKIDEWISWALQGEEKVARKAQKIQEQRVALYKKVSLAYIKALMEKDAIKSYNHLKKYNQALRKIQSADADILTAEADLLVAEQKLVADMVSTMPLVGDALDVLSLATGEDLSGEKLSNLERGIGIILLLTPNTIEQVIKRNPSISRYLGMLSAHAANIKDDGVNKAANLIGSQKIQNLIQKTFKSRDIDKWRRHYYQKLREQERLASLSQKELGELLDKSEKVLTSSGIRKVGVDSIDTNEVLSLTKRKQIDEVAKKNNTIIITRPVNKDADKWIELGASTKGMPVKGKSADTGLFAGLIPKKQKYSKLKNADEINNFQNKVNNSLNGEARYVNYTPDEIKTFQKAVRENKPNAKIGNQVYSKEQMEGILQREVANPLVGSKQLKLSVNGEVYKAVELPKIGGDQYAKGLVLYKKGNKYYNKNFVEVDMNKIKKYDTTTEEPFEVLTNTDGKILTADLDLLDVGTKGKREIMQDDSIMGNIDSHDTGIIHKINKATKDERYPNQKLSHHGGETSFINKQSRPDFPVVAHTPDGQFVIKDEKQLKIFYHHQKLKGFDLEPNPFWNWGEWNPKGGYKIKSSDSLQKMEKVNTQAKNIAKHENRNNYQIELVD